MGRTPKQASVNKYYFHQTNDLHDEIVSLHDFILPTATALWHFRGVIANEFNDDRLVTVSSLGKKYNLAPGTRRTTNLATAFRKHSWDFQIERLAEVALVNVIAIFEAWCDEICDLFGKKESLLSSYNFRPDRKVLTVFALR